VDRTIHNSDEPISTSSTKANLSAKNLVVQAQTLRNESSSDKSSEDFTIPFTNSTSPMSEDQGIRLAMNSTKDYNNNKDQVYTICQT
jgi:hypothetical protein